MHVHDVGADVLRDAARLSLGDPRLTDRVQQRRLAVVHVAHDRDDRRPWDLRVFRLFRFLEERFRQALGGHLDLYTERFGDQRGRVRGNRLVQGQHRSHVHQLADHFGGLLSQRFGKILDGEPFRQLDRFQARLGDFGRWTARRVPGFFLAPVHRHRAQVAPAGRVIAGGNRFFFPPPPDPTEFLHLIPQAKQVSLRRVRRQPLFACRLTIDAGGRQGRLWRKRHLRRQGCW